jgi:hypothetical protein
MIKKNLFLAAVIYSLLSITACGGNNNKDENAKSDSETPSATAEPGTDPKGVGKHRNVELTHPLDEKMIASGTQIYDLKCASCHKLTDERLVGPGWKGVTDRRTPEWIMNFVTNTDEMLQTDTAALNMLEICLVKMPNQNLTDTDARSVLEMMRKNDGKN